MLQIKNVSKTYGSETIVKNINLAIEDGEFVVLVGPSGCGKTTVLKMVAGLESVSAGEIYLSGQLLNYKSPQQRKMAMVFQNYALYPHMTVRQNMSFAMKIRGIKKQKINQKVTEVAVLLGLETYLDSKPAQLSGGQKQRVAIGNLLVRETSIYLMDEPLSNLDAKLRAQMRVELAKIHQELHTTVIYVTHDQTEAMTLASKVVVMNAGEVQQIASPEQIYRNPVNRFVAGFFGTPAMNFLEGEIMIKDGAVQVATKAGHWRVTQRQAMILTRKHYPGKYVCVGIRPESVFAVPADSGQGVFRFQAKVGEWLGGESFLHGSIGNSPFCLRFTAHNASDGLGEALLLGVHCEEIVMFDPDTGENIFIS